MTSVEGHEPETDLNVAFPKSITVITAQPRKRELGLTEHKLFSYLMFRYRQKPGRSEIHAIPMRDVQAYLGNINTQKIIESLQALTSLDIDLEYVDEEGPHHVSCNFLSIDATRSDNGMLRYAFDPIIKQFLHYPQVYGLPVAGTARRFRSVYAAQLYDLLSAFRNRRRPVWEVESVDEFRRHMRIPDNRLPRWDNLRDRAIERPLKEINEIAEFTASVSYKRGGRGGKVRGLVFYVHERSPEEAARIGMAQNRSKRDTETIDLLDGRTDVERYGLPPLNSATLDQAQEMLGGDEKILQEHVEHWYRENAGRSIRDADGEFLLWLTNELGRAHDANVSEETMTALLDRWFDQE